MPNPDAAWDAALQSTDPVPREARFALLTVSAAVLLCTSIWFSGTAASSALKQLWQLSATESAWLTISVQLGFITGTFLYALLNLPDIFPARLVFFVSAVLGSLFNLGFAGLSEGLAPAVLLRFLSGVTLAGIYPVGMKIVAAWFRSGLGWRLAVLIAALTLGKASAYLFQSLQQLLSWRLLAALPSAAALLGGVLVWGLLRDGPYLKERAAFDAAVMFRVFRERNFRHTALGYFGHMWELYAFWALISHFLAERSEGLDRWPIPLLTSLVIGVGALGCLAGGLASRRYGQRRIAVWSLAVSGSLCALSGWLFRLPWELVLSALVLWGFFVIADSAQFSALATRFCPPRHTGTALTVQNGVGFGVTVLSIQLLSLAAPELGWRWAFTLLAPGPLLGVWFMLKLPATADREPTLFVRGAPDGEE